MVDITNYFSGVGAGIMNSLKLLIYLLPVLLILVISIISIRNKAIYKFPVRIYRVRENGKVKEINRKGGFIGRKNSAPFFRIKTGRWWWQYVDLNKTPNPAYFDEQDRVYYKQIDVDTYIQLKRVFPNPKNEVQFSPVEPDVKYGAILAVQRIKDVLRTEPTWKKVLPYASLIILGIIFIVAYAMLMNNCGG